MYIMDGPGKNIINSDFVERFCTVDKPDAGLVIASYGDDRPPFTLSRYKTLEEAQSALADMINALGGGQMIYYMPDSTLYHEQVTKKDARTRRKGGS